MTKLKNIFNDILNGWSGLYMTIYGIISFIIGLYATVINGLEAEFSIEIIMSFLFFCIIVSGSACGIISVVSPITLGISQAPKKIRIFVGLPLLIICLYLLIQYGIQYSKIEYIGSGIFFLIYILYGLPYATILFILPILILIILDCKHKILPPKEIFKNNIIKLFFVSYTIVCWIFICWLVIGFIMS